MPNMTTDLEWTIAKIRLYAGTHGTDNLRALLIEDQKMTEREVQDQAHVYAGAYGALAYLANDLIQQLEAAAEPAPRGLASCGHPANEDGECDCSSWPERSANLAI